MTGDIIEKGVTFRAYCRVLFFSMFWWGGPKSAREGAWRGAPCGPSAGGAFHLLAAAALAHPPPRDPELITRTAISSPGNQEAV